MSWDRKPKVKMKDLPHCSCIKSHIPIPMNKGRSLVTNVFSINLKLASLLHEKVKKNYEIKGNTGGEVLI